MPFLPALLAVRDRLSGSDRKHIPALDHGSPVSAFSYDRDGSGGTSVQIANALRAPYEAEVGKLTVPLFFGKIAGRDWKVVYPSISYDITGLAPRLRDWKTPSDGYPVHHPTRFIPGSRRPDDPGGTVGLIARRPPAQPFNMTLEVCCYATDLIAGSFLVQHVLSVLQLRDYLRVPEIDGTYKTWRVLFGEYEDHDSEAAIVARLGLEGEYFKRVTYVLEGFLDTTGLERLEPTLRRPTINVSRRNR